MTDETQDARIERKIDMASFGLIRLGEVSEQLEAFRAKYGQHLTDRVMETNDDASVICPHCGRPMINVIDEHEKMGMFTINEPVGILWCRHCGTLAGPKSWYDSKDLVFVKPEGER